MRHFLVSVVKFCLLLSIPFLIELFVLPSHYFSFRIYEGIKAKSYSFEGPFYPNKAEEKIEYGDLGHHTSYAVAKHNRWVTDSLGYRNTKFISNPDVLFIGRSNSYGSSLDQSQIVSEYFQKETNILSYNIGPASLQNYIRLNKCSILEKPKVIVFFSIERNLLTVPRVFPNKRYPCEAKNYTKFSELADRAKKQNMKAFVKSRIKKNTGFGRISTINKEFLIAKGLTWRMPIKKLNITLDRVKKYAEYCEKAGIKFIFVPIPNRETIYFDYVPWETQPEFLSLLKEQLDENNILNIDVLSLFNSKRNEGVEMYQKDDTHWNSKGVELVVEELKKTIIDD